MAERRGQAERGLPPIEEDPTWTVVVEGFDPDHERWRESLLVLADGRIGTAGAILAHHVEQRRWTLAIGLYQGDGPDTQLMPGPVGFHLPFALDGAAELRRVLDLRHGVLHEDADTDVGPVRSARFTSLARPGTAAMRAWCPRPPEGPMLVASSGGPFTDGGGEDGAAWMRARALPTDGGMAAAAVQEVAPATDPDVATEGRPVPVVVDRFVVHDVDVDKLPPPDAAVRTARDAADAGFDALLAEHTAAWQARWDDADIVIDGDPELQHAVRFTLFHLMASVPDDGEAAVGARGLTGQGYRGHVFWDADTFTMPFLSATHPASARAMIEYRLRRLPEALAGAAERGLDGARFPWESARSGRDVTPTSARDWSGKLVPIRTGQLEEHIVAQVAWAASDYVDWTGDQDLALGTGLRMLVETARYWHSRVRVTSDRRAHLYGVIGPDEYHEPVDDNACTNVMARWNLRRAATAVERAPTAVEGVSAHEVEAWRSTADALVDGYDADTGVYEEFTGFHDLEPLIIAEVAPRRPITADLLLGPERVHGAQVVKQADVLMLHHLVPDEVVPGSLEPNLRFYEPRTAHGSSLSPAVHASLFARARDYERALAALRISARIDLDDLTGTTASGLHLATMGSVWQALVFGFAGIRPRHGRLEVDPRLPPTWGGMEVPVRYRGSRVRVRIERARMVVRADPMAAVTVDGQPYLAGPDGLEFVREGAVWRWST